MKSPTNMLLGLAVALVTMSPVWAQDMTPGSAPGSQTPAAATQPAMSADLTGQAIYNTSGRQIGTVASMSTDAQGQQTAVVSIEKFLGIGGKQVEFPVSSLSPKSDGGYTTALTDKEIKKLLVHKPASHN